MANSADHIITSLSSSITQRVFCNSKVAPFQLGVNSAAQLRLYAASALTSFPGPNEPKQDDQTVDAIGLKLLTYYKFAALTSGDTVIRMNNWEGPTVKMPDPADFAGTNNAGYLTDPTQVPKSTCGAMVPNLYRSYPATKDLYYFTGTLGAYVGRDAYRMSSSQTESADGEYWECYKQSFGHSHGLTLTFPSINEDSSVEAIYKSLDTSFALSLWYKSDRVAWRGAGVTGLYGQLSPFCVGGSTLGALTADSFFGLSFGYSAWYSKLYMAFGYGNSRYDGTNWHVYSDAGDNAIAIADIESWHHIVLAVSGTAYDNRTASFYLDGLPLTCSLVNGAAPGATTMTKDFDFSTTSAPSSNAECRILLFNELRGGPPAMGFGFPGGLTEFAYFNDALTQAEVTALYNDGNGAEATSILASTCPSRCVPSS